MAFDYSPLTATATALLEKFGQQVTLRRSAGGTYDPVTGSYTGATAQSQTAYAALLEYSTIEAGAKFADGSMLRVGDKKCLIQGGLTWAPDETTTLTDANGAAWNLERVQPTAPSGVAVLYAANATR